MPILPARTTSDSNSAADINALSENAINKDGTTDFTGDQSMGGNKLTDLTDPTNTQDAATKNYVDTNFYLYLFDNAIINPSFNVDQYQRIPLSSVTNDEYDIDRWKNIVSGVTVESSKPDGYRFTASSTATGSLGYHQLIEQFSILQGATVTLSAQVKSNSSNARLIIDDGVGLTEGSVHTGSGDYETLSVTHVVDASATQLSCQARIYDGGTVSISTGDYIEAKDFKLSYGSVVSQFSHRQISEEYDLCYRYYQSWYGQALRFAFGNWSSGTRIYAPVFLKKPMRTTPSVSHNNLRLLREGVSWYNVTSTVIVTESNGDTVTIQANLSATSGASGGDTGWIGTQTTGSPYLRLSAEL